MAKNDLVKVQNSAVNVLVPAPSGQGGNALSEREEREIAEFMAEMHRERQKEQMSDEYISGMAKEYDSKYNQINLSKAIDTKRLSKGGKEVYAMEGHKDTKEGILDKIKDAKEFATSVVESVSKAFTKPEKIDLPKETGLNIPGEDYDKGDREIW